MSPALRSELQQMPLAKLQTLILDSQEHQGFGWRLARLPNSIWAVIFYIPTSEPEVEGPWSDLADAYLAIDNWCISHQIPLAS